MSVADIPKPVKLFCGIIFLDCQKYPTEILQILCNQFGKICLRSPVICFTFTDYYFKEMGKPLKRMWIAFEDLIPRDRIADIKLSTNELEVEFQDGDGNRTVNLDPGYLSLSKVVLASAKNYAHRIYLKEGIFAQLDFRFINNTWHPMEWTYPDYQSETGMDFLYKLREIYKSQLNEI